MRVSGTKMATRRVRSSVVWVAGWAHSIIRYAAENMGFDGRLN